MLKCKIITNVYEYSKSLNNRVGFVYHLPGIRLYPGRVENLGGEVAAEEPPRGAVRSRADITLITRHNSTGGRGFGSVGEDGAVLNQSLVSETVAGDKDGRIRTDSESDKGPILRSELPENLFDVR